MDALINVVLPVFGIILTGYLAGRFEALGPEHLDYHRVAHLLDHQPALRQRMAALNGAVGAA